MQKDDIITSDEILDEDEDTQKDRYLSFKIGDEDYAVEIEFVIEIIGIQNFTKIPNTKDFIRGIINLRGNIIPVIEIRRRFGMTPREFDERTCIIVIAFENVTVGIIVDEVNEVLNIPEDQTSLPPQTYKGSQSMFIKKFGKSGDDVKIILDIHELLFDKDMIH